MESQVQALKKQIKQAYQKKDMQKRIYHLHSICIHDGNATSGHYYTYIYDRFQKIWRKYDDITVKTVKEEHVFKEAEGGGNSSHSAYWLVYVNDETKQVLDKLDINAYSPAQKSHAYGRMISQPIQD